MRVNVQIENDKLHYREHAQSKCGSLDYRNHTPGGSDKKVFTMSHGNAYTVVTAMHESVGNGNFGCRNCRTPEPIDVKFGVRVLSERVLVCLKVGLISILVLCFSEII